MLYDYDCRRVIRESDKEILERFGAPGACSNHDNPGACSNHDNFIGNINRHCIFCRLFEHCISVELWLWMCSVLQLLNWKSETSCCGGVFRDSDGLNGLRHKSSLLILQNTVLFQALVFESMHRLRIQAPSWHCQSLQKRLKRIIF